MNGGWENYWTAGYNVGTSADVIVDRYCRSEKAARDKANIEAHAPLRSLNHVGAEVEITVWVEHWRTRRVEERDERVVTATLKSKRRTEITEKVDMTEVDA